MACKQCGGSLNLTESNGGTTEGRFSETYACVNCNAFGRIEGNAGSKPESWNYYGQVFQE